MSDTYEYCPNCDANLTLQKGYDNSLPYWICRGCGEMLINPDVPSESDIIWRCDRCGAFLNIQPGFTEEAGDFRCTECGFINNVNPETAYESEDERIADEMNPYKGLSDEEVLELSDYRDISFVGDREDVIFVEEVESGKCYIKKLLSVYDRSVYNHLKNNPVSHMPRIISLYESRNCLVIVEEYIKGETLEEILCEKAISIEKTIDITKAICVILDELHNLKTPIIHRDIKPSNVMITDGGEVYLLDMNVAKWYNPDKVYDTEYLGTKNFAAPEQVGFGLKASSTASDIYALGMLMNVMLTGTFPKEKKAEGAIWTVIERCINLEADKRYTARELMDELEMIRSGL